MDTNRRLGLLVLCCALSGCGVFSRHGGVLIEEFASTVLDCNTLSSMPSQHPWYHIDANTHACHVFATVAQPGTHVGLVGTDDADLAVFEDVSVDGTSGIWCPQKTTFSLGENDVATFIYASPYWVCVSVKEAINADD